MGEFTTEACSAFEDKPLDGLVGVVPRPTIPEQFESASDARFCPLLTAPSDIRTVTTERMPRSSEASRFLAPAHVFDYCLHNLLSASDSVECTA
jgi:hypothetical protein